MPTAEELAAPPLVPTASLAELGCSWMSSWSCTMSSSISSSSGVVAFAPSLVYGDDPRFCWSAEDLNGLLDDFGCSFFSSLAASDAVFLSPAFFAEPASCSLSRIFYSN